MHTSFVRHTLFGAIIGFAAALSACRETTPPPKPAPVIAPESSRQLSSGPVVGFDHAAGGHAWLGIPYAAPPVGDLRWRAPRPVAPWREQRNSMSFGSPCIQLGSPLGGVGKGGEHAGSEDCLFANVYAPRMNREEAHQAKLPVMVWIHGGGNTIGHAGFYDGGHLSVAGKVIVVTFNYRLGPFGWFMHPALADATNQLDGTGNYGTLDTIAALRWVHAQAAAFGGDASNVTVFGESAGGTNTLALMLSPLAHDLFHRAIVQSGGLGFNSIASASHYHDEATPGDANSSAEVLTRLLIADKRVADRAAAKTKIAAMSASEIAAYLRSKPAWTVFEAYGAKGLLGPRLPDVFQDGVVIRLGEPLQLLADPASHIAVPILIGTNRDEPKIFMAFDPTQVFSAFGIPLLAKHGEAYDRNARYGAMSWKVRGVDEIATALTTAGQTVFTYRWDWDEQGTKLGFINLSHLLGAAHGLEIPFVFGYFDLGPTSSMLFTDANAKGRLQLSDAMLSYWANFARRGTPDRGVDDQLVPWTAWTNMPGVPKLMLLATTAGGGTRMTDLTLTRAGLLTSMAQEPISSEEKCKLFDNTFRFDSDAWANTARKTFNNGACAPKLAAKAPQ